MDAIFAKNKAQVLDHMLEGIDNMIVSKQVCNPRADAKVDPLTEQNQTMSVFTSLSSSSYASNPSKPIFTKTKVVITNFTSLPYSSTLSELSQQPVFLFKPNPKNLRLCIENV